MKNSNQYMLDKIKLREENDSLRKLSINSHLIDFASNDYLGIAKKYQSGSTGSRLISGNNQQIVDLERKFSMLTSFEASLFFNSGFQANVGLIPALSDRNTTIFYDELIHASLRDGIRLSVANSFSFKHNDLENLSEKLAKAEGRILILVEAIYSMDGDSPDLQSLLSIAKRHHAEIIVDEAHSFGIFGEKGLGMVNDLNLSSQILATIFPLGKAVGSSGCFISGSQLLKDYLTNFCRSFIYSTAPSRTIIKEVNTQIDALNIDNSRDKVFELKKYFLDGCNNNFKIISSVNSAIVSILIPNTKELKNVESEIQKAGLFVKAILHPTVPKGLERLRVCIHSFNTRKEIDLLLNTLNKKN